MGKYFVIALLFILEFLSCNKKDNTSVYSEGYVRISQEVKDYFVFNPGTYWIYEDSLSGAIDSVKVTGTNLTTVSQQKGSYGEEVSVHMSTSFYKNSPYLTLAYYTDGPVIGDVNHFVFDTGRRLYSVPPYPDSGISSYNKNSNFMDTAIYFYPFKTLQQNNQVINNVVKTYDTNLFEYTVNGHCPRGNLYFKDHLFIVRKEIKGDGVIPDRVWILKQEYIVQ